MKISSQGFHFKWSQAKGGRPQVGVGVGRVLLSAGRYEYVDTNTLQRKAGRQGRYDNAQSGQELGHG